jgi:hypothetical protein
VLIAPPASGRARGGKLIPSNGSECCHKTTGYASPSAEDRLPKSLRFAESDVIIFVVRASGVHELGYGHKWDWEA